VGGTHKRAKSASEYIFEFFPRAAWREASAPGRSVRRRWTETGFPPYRIGTRILCSIACWVEGEEEEDLADCPETRTWARVVLPPPGGGGKVGREGREGGNRGGWRD